MKLLQEVPEKQHAHANCVFVLTEKVSNWRKIIQEQKQKRDRWDSFFSFGHLFIYSVHKWNITHENRKQAISNHYFQLSPLDQQTCNWTGWGRVFLFFLPKFRKNKKPSQSEDLLNKHFLWVIVVEGWHLLLFISKWTVMKVCTIVAPEPLIHRALVQMTLCTKMLKANRLFSLQSFVKALLLSLSSPKTYTHVKSGESAAQQWTLFPFFSRE